MLSYAAPGVEQQTQCQRSSREEHALAASNLRGDRAADEQDPQVHIDDRQPVERVPRGVERAEQPHTVRRRQIHQDVEGGAGERDADQPADRRDGFRFSAHALHTPDNERADQRKAEHAEHAVRRAAMRGQVRHRSARDGRDDVEVGRVRRDHHGRGGAGCAASDARTHQRDPDERVCDVIQPR